MFKSAVRRVRSLRPSLESLEGRTLLSMVHPNPFHGEPHCPHKEFRHHHPIPNPVSNQIVVNTLADDPSGAVHGQTTLRDAINLAEAMPTTSKPVIKIAVSGTIVLGAQLPQLTGNITIDGPGATNLTIQGSDGPAVFLLTSNSNVAIEGVTVTGSAAPHGAVSISQGAVLTLSNDVFSNDHAVNGGAIYNVGTTTIVDSVFSSDYAGPPSPYQTYPNVGGAIDNLGSLIISGSTFSGDVAGSGGAIANFGTAVITASTFENNGFLNNPTVNYTSVGPNVLVDGSTTVDGSFLTSSF